MEKVKKIQRDETGDNQDQSKRNKLQEERANGSGKKPKTHNGDLANLPAVLQPLTKHKRWVCWDWHSAKLSNIAIEDDSRAPITEAASVAHKIKPSGIYAYIDKVTVWLKQPLAKAQQAWFQSRSGGHVDLRRNGEYARSHNRVVRVSFPDRSYLQRMQLNQPQLQALKRLERRNDVHMTYVEFSLDWTFDDEASRDEAFEFFCRFNVKKYHRGEHGIPFFKKTRYTSKRSVPNVLAAYSDKECRITGEVFCVHLEWRVKGCIALRRAGVHSIADLINLDHRVFWESRLLFYAADPGRLGRSYHNHFKGTNRRTPWMQQRGKFIYNNDERAGYLIMHAWPMQHILEIYKKKFDIGRCLIPIDTRHLLPTPLS